jgi:hypothetical protein
VELASGNSASTKIYRDRLELYRQHKPFRDLPKEGAEKKEEIQVKTERTPL